MSGESSLFSMMRLMICLLLVGAAIISSADATLVYKHCGDVLRHGAMSNGSTFTISLVGTSFHEVECLQTGPTTAVTVIHHDKEQRTHVNGYESAGSFKAYPDYQLPVTAITALKELASRCEQNMKVECIGVYTGDHWLEGLGGTQIRYNSPTNPYAPGCECIFQESCTGGSQSCHCNQNSNWKLDEGNLHDSATVPLPVTGVRGGDTGGTNEQLYYTLGPLRCYHICTPGSLGIKHCGHLAASGTVLSNTDYDVDPEGLEDSIVTVQCELSGSSEAVTIIHHNMESRHHVIGHETAGSYEASPQYDISERQLTALKSSAIRCEQYMKVESRDVSAVDNWLVFQKDKVVKYEDDKNPYYPPCRCIFNESCSAGYTGCPGLNTVGQWGTSEGYLHDSDATPLPVKTVAVGDTGNAGEELYFTLGPLRCYHHVTDIQSLKLRLGGHRKLSQDTAKLTDGSESTCITFMNKKDVTAHAQILPLARSQYITVVVIGRDLPTGDISATGDYPGTVVYVGRDGPVQDYSGDFTACQQTTVTSSSASFSCHCKYGPCANVFVRIVTPGGNGKYEICELQVVGA